MSRPLLLLVFVPLALAACASAGPAHDMYAAGGEAPSDIYKGWTLYQQLADNNTVAGQISLADLTKQDRDGYRSAYYWYRRAVLDGSGVAAANLWYLYNTNYKGPGESPEAITYYHLASLSDEGRRQLYALETKAAVDSERHAPVSANRGTALIEFDRGEDGKAANVKVYRSSGDADIDQAAMAAVENASLPELPPALAEVRHFIISVKIGPES